MSDEAATRLAPVATLRGRIEQRLINAPLAERMSVWRLMAYAAPYIPLAVFATPVSTYVPVFYTQELGVSLTAAGLIFMLARFWDGFTDPLMGLISDRYPTRFGRRRHWIVASVPILMLATVLVFMPRLIVGEQAPALYLLIGMFILYLGYTLAILSHMSWGAELSTGYHERSRVQGWREFIHVVGGVGVLGIAIVIERTTGGLDRGTILSAMGWFALVLLPICAAVAVLSVGERKVEKTEPLRWRDGMMVLIKNKLILRLLAADILILSPTGVMSALFAYYVQYVLQTPDWTGIALLAYASSAIIGVPLWIWLSRFMSKHRAVTLSVAFHAVNTLAALRFGPGDHIGFIFYCFTQGIVFGGGTTFLLRSIMADVIDDDHIRSGSRRTGLIFSLMAMTTKIGPAVGVGLTYPLLEFFGFDPASKMLSADGVDVLRYIFVLFPVALAGGAALLLFNFPLDAKRQQELREAIEARESES